MKKFYNLEINGFILAVKDIVLMQIFKFMIIFLQDSLW